MALQELPLPVVHLAQDSSREEKRSVDSTCSGMSEGDDALLSEPSYRGDLSMLSIGLGMLRKTTTLFKSRKLDRRNRNTFQEGV